MKILKLDFAEVSFFNHCCAGLSNATWTWNLGPKIMEGK